jgi:hypothetical protein
MVVSFGSVLRGLRYQGCMYCLGGFCCVVTQGVFGSWISYLVLYWVGLAWGVFGQEHMIAKGWDGTVVGHRINSGIVSKLGMVQGMDK